MNLRSSSPPGNIDLLRELVSTPEGRRIILDILPPSVAPSVHSPKQRAMYRYMSQLGSDRSQDFWSAEYPSDSSIDLWYNSATMTSLIANISPGIIFDGLDFTLVVQPTPASLAREAFQSFVDLHPWALHLKGSVPGDAMYLINL